MGSRFLIVPLNEDGLEEYDYCVEDTVNVIKKELPLSEYNVLVNKGIFSRFNEKFTLNISDYECEEITSENLYKALEFVLPLADKLPVFVGALHLAIEKHTLLGINL